MRWIVIVLIFVATEVSSQINPSEWKLIESFVRNKSINNAKELRAFGKSISLSFDDSMQRLRAAYLWVIENIRYDCEGLKLKNSRWALDSVLKYKKAVCAGYVNVFRNLCEAAGLECVDVSGFGRSGFEDLIVRQDSFASNHTWNAIRIGGSWRLVDVTWASGFTSEDCKSFTRHRNDWYFCTDPKKFIWDHFPKDPEWQLIDQPVTWAAFRTYPLLFPGVEENHLSGFYPNTSTLVKTKGDTIHFKFQTEQSYNRIIISSRKSPALYKIDYLTSINEGYQYIYLLEKTGDYDLQIDLLNIVNLQPNQSYQVNSYTDIVYWLNVR